MKTIAIIALAAAITTAATPVFAKAPNTASNDKVTFNAKANTYCFKEARADSRIPHVECRTKEDWADAGLTITHKQPVHLAQR